MNYVFNNNGECVIISHKSLQYKDGYTLIESDEVYNPWEIRLIDGEIVKQEIKEEPTEEHPHELAEEREDITLPPSLPELAESVAGLYELLASVVPPSEEESEGEHE